MLMGRGVGLGDAPSVNRFSKDIRAGNIGDVADEI